VLVSTGLVALITGATGTNGVFYGGGGRLLAEQALAIVAVVAFSFGVTWIIAAAVTRTIGLRVPAAGRDEMLPLIQGCG
jgi:ammonium transporter, Amt family